MPDSTPRCPARAPGVLLAAVAASLTLVSCGGGGGSSGSTPPPSGSAPTATLTAPAAFASSLAGTITLGADASDDLGVSAVEFQVDGIAVGNGTANATGTSFTLALDTTSFASGQHVIRARARDASANLSGWSSATVQFAGSRTQPAGFTRNDAWVAGLNNATAFTQAPDGRLFVAEQGGALRVVKNGQLLATPFVTLLVDSAGERGLLGVTLHPNFANNQLVYLYHTTAQGGTHNRISRFVANGDVAAAGTETPIVDLPALSSATNHNGGALHFGLDGKLYAAVGDNANSARAQDRSHPFGKLLRFNDDGSIPSDNPFCSTPATLACAVWAYGLRNPYTFAVQPGSGNIAINDVGEGTWEEINLGRAGANYGWPNSEGPDNVGAGVTAPLFAYRHSATNPPGSGPGGFFTGVAITGGAFYPDSGTFPAAYRGQYFFADFGSKFVARYDAANNAAYAFGSVGGNPVDMLVGSDGALHVLTRTGIARFAAN